MESGNQICGRCHKPTASTIMSMFDTSMICPHCKEEERNHPRYEQAREAELATLLAGDYNFPGIGWPPDGESADHRIAPDGHGAPLPRYCLTMERTQRVAVYFDAPNDAAAEEWAAELEDAMSSDAYGQGDEEYDSALCEEGTGRTIIDWK